MKPQSEHLSEQAYTNNNLKNSLSPHLSLAPFSDTASQDLRSECELLHQEIAQNDVITLQILGAIIVLTGALVTVALSNSATIPYKWALFFVMGIIALIGLRQNTHRLKSVYITASYIKIFIEPKTEHMKWETRLAAFRNKKLKDYGGELIIHQMGIYVMILFGNLFLASYFLIHDNNYYPYISSYITTNTQLYNLWKFGISEWLPPVVIALSLTLLFWIPEWRKCTKISRNHTEVYDKAWSEIRNAEQMKEIICSSIDSKSYDGEQRPNKE